MGLLDREFASGADRGKTGKVALKSSAAAAQSGKASGGAFFLNFARTARRMASGLTLIPALEQNVHWVDAPAACALRGW